MSVAQRLARLSQQYPFHPLRRCCAAGRPTLHNRCLGYQSSASRAAEHKAADENSLLPADGSEVNGRADNAAPAPPPLFAPLLSSILTFMQRRAQQAQQSPSTAPHTAASEPSTRHSPPSTSQPSFASPTVDLDDPAISLLFPRLPLLPPPPLHPQPPFPVPPVSRTIARTSPAAYATYSKWYNSLPLRTRLHVLLMKAATADARFVLYLERLAARKGEAGWEEEMAAVSRRRMAEVRVRSKREDKLLEAMWQEERTVADWQQMEKDRDKLIVELRGRHWQERWIRLDSQLKSDAGTAEERKTWLYERNRAEAEIRAHVRLLGHTNRETMERKIADLLRETRNGTVSEWRWQDKARIKRRESELHEWKARTVRAMLTEQAEWHEVFTRQRAVELQKAARQREHRVAAVATELQPIDWSHPPQSFDELLTSFCYQHSERYKLELWRQRWYIDETAQRAHEQQHLTSDDRRFKQRARFSARLRTEAKLLAAVQDEQAATERQKRQSIRSIVQSYLSPIRSPLTGWHVYQLLRLVVREGQLVGLSTAVSGRTSEEVFDGVSLAGAVPPAPLPASIAVTPFSWPYMLSYVAETARASMPVVRVREEEDGSTGGGAANIVIEVRNTRRDAVVWMYEAMREVRASISHADWVTWGQVVRVGRGGEAEADGEGMEAVGGGAADAGGEHGWCVLDMGDVVVQTHSEDDTSGVSARRWLSEAETKQRLSAISVTRINIITAAG